MSITDYLVDSALVLLVLLQIKERTLSIHSLVRPLLIVGIAVASYFKSIPTAGNDLVLIGVLAAFGLMLGTAAGHTTFVRRREDGVVVARAGWLAGFFWVLGMGLRFAFLVWINHSGAASLAHFSETHSITNGQAWTDALLAMAVFEVLGRSGLLYLRRNRAQAELPSGAELA
ncbi:MAG TPA: hypothetical protein VMF07_15395 [Solirubrobacteraceae bacterium]|nr:hypothetical protein [Solirubrobacteraceae bacterium]